MKYSVRREGENWVVWDFDAGGSVAKFETNAAAWRWIDLANHDDLSPSERRADYGFRQGQF